MELKGHISPSQLHTFTECGLRWYFRYVENKIVPPAMAMHRGKGVHAGAELNFTQKIESRTDLPVTDIVDCAAASFEDSLAKGGIRLNADEETEGLDKVKGKSLDETVKCARVFGESVAPLVQPTMVEKRIVVPLECGIDRPHLELLGIMDVVAMVDPADVAKGERVRDLKIRSKTPAKDAIEKDAQLSFYALLYKQLRGVFPVDVTLDTIVCTKEPKYAPAMSTRDEEDVRVVLYRLSRMIQAIEKDVFTPADPGWWGCSRDWCGYYGECPAVRNRGRVIVDQKGE